MKKIGAADLANSAYNSIISLNLGSELNTRKAFPPAYVLYHYTNADGLKGIVEKNELWATSAYSLNDLAEITYGYGVLAEALKLWLAKNPRPAESLTLGLGRDLEKWFGEQLFKREVVHPIYLACFCEEDNLLSQWRAYGQSGGYSIGFQISPDRFVSRDFKPEPNIYTSRLVKVEYDRATQLKRCKEILDRLLPTYDDRDLAAAIAELGNNPLFGYSQIIRGFQDVLLDLTVGFKNPAFSVEKEWRIVIRSREFTKQATDDGGSTPVPLHFRSSRGGLLPYIKLAPVEAGKLSITAIRCGPTLDKMAAQRRSLCCLITTGSKHEFLAPTFL
jgi:hypothetical protein